MPIEAHEDSICEVVPSKKNLGFTLTEVAIVLGIVGIVIGVIWIAAATVYTNMRISRSNQHLIYITQAVRSIYATSVTTAAATDGTALTGSLIPAGAFTSDTLPNGLASTLVNSAWAGGTINVYSSSMPGSSANTGDAFVVQFEGIPSRGCINLLTALTGTRRDPGMAGATGTNSASTNVMLTGFINLILSTSTLTATAAAAACGNSDLSTAAFQFRLRG